jgi:hypothetical protein
VEALASGLGWTLGAASLLLLPSVARADETIPADHFAIQPVADGAVIATGAGFSVLLGMVLNTGEIQPLPVAPDAEDRLLGVDRIAVTQTIDPHAGTYSDIGLYAGIGLAVVDTVSTAFRDHWEAALTDGVMYAESVSLTLAVDDLPWLTLAGGTLLTGFVGYERVRAGAHFPTDVIMGALAGASIGVLVPHLHRRGTRPVWVDFAPAPRGSGATLGIGGFF